MAEDALQTPAGGISLGVYVGFPSNIVRNGKCPKSPAHGSDLPCPQPLPEAIAAGVFGLTEDGNFWPDESQVQALTEEQANELIILFADVQYLRWCAHYRLDPATGKYPRSTAREKSLDTRIQQELHTFTQRYEDCLAAYAEGFGFDGADALDAYVRCYVAEHFAPNESPVVQKKLF